MIRLRHSELYAVLLRRKPASAMFLASLREAIF